MYYKIAIDYVKDIKHVIFKKNKRENHIVVNRTFIIAFSIAIRKSCLPDMKKNQNDNHFFKKDLLNVGIYIDLQKSIFN